MFLSVSFKQKKTGINRLSALQPEFLGCRMEREKGRKVKCFYSLYDEESGLKKAITFLHDRKLVPLKLCFHVHLY